VKRTVGAVAFIAYIAAIVLANWMISHVGTPTPFHTHTLPVGFGLVAPSGTYAAALAFPARDVVQRTVGRVVGFVAIVVGAALSFAVSSHTIAFASGATFLTAETLDMLIYTPLQRRWFAPAVIVSGLVGAVVNAWMFLTLAHLPVSSNMPGLLVGTVWVILAGGAIAAGLRRTKPLAVAA
jgi:queuosine precursor transporter